MVALFCALLTLAAPQKSEPPLKRVDRTKAVGAPVLDEKTKEGVYVWLEDGWFNVAVVAHPKKGKRSMTVTVRSTKKIQNTEGDFRADVRSNGVTFRAAVGQLPVKGRFKTEGEITVSASHALFVGPLSKRAASTMTIGRY
jgi:hypothetical protein